MNCIFKKKIKNKITRQQKEVRNFRPKGKKQVLNTELMNKLELVGIRIAL